MCQYFCYGFRKFSGIGDGFVWYFKFFCNFYEVWILQFYGRVVVVEEKFLLLLYYVQEVVVEQYNFYCCIYLGVKFEFLNGYLEVFIVDESDYFLFWLC